MASICLIMASGNSCSYACSSFARTLVFTAVSMPKFFNVASEYTYNVASMFLYYCPLLNPISTLVAICDWFCASCLIRRATFFTAISINKSFNLRPAPKYSYTPQDTEGRIPILPQLLWTPRILRARVVQYLTGRVLFSIDAADNEHTSNREQECLINYRDTKPGIEMACKQEAIPASVKGRIGCVTGSDSARLVGKK
jgi:hypothetical protein